MERISNGKQGHEPPMKTDKLLVTASNTTDAIPAPGAGFKLRVYAAYISVRFDAASVFSVNGSLYFATSGQTIWAAVTLSSTGGMYRDHLSGICVEGAENEALTLLNDTLTAGTGYIQAIVFYHIIRM